MFKQGLGIIFAGLIGVLSLSGCAMLGDGIPADKLGSYALVESDIGLISWINGNTVFPARQSLNMAPGEYDFQVGIGCENTATCRASRPYKLVVKAGMRYVLTRGDVMVSDRFTPRDKAKQTPYMSLPK